MGILSLFPRLGPKKIIEDSIAIFLVVFTIVSYISIGNTLHEGDKFSAVSSIFFDIVFGILLVLISLCVAHGVLYVSTSSPISWFGENRQKIKNDDHYPSSKPFWEYIEIRSGIRDFSVSRAFLLSQLIRTGMWTIVWCSTLPSWYRTSISDAWQFDLNWWPLAERTFLFGFVLDFCLDVPFTHSKASYFLRLHTFFDIINLPICMWCVKFLDNPTVGSTPLDIKSYLQLLGWLRFWRLFGLSPSLKTIFETANPVKLQLVSVLLAISTVVLMLASGFFVMEGLRDPTGIGGGNTRDFFPEALYYSVVTTSTTGYGDITPQLRWSRAFAFAMIVIVLTIIPQELQHLLFLSRLPKRQLGGLPSRFDHHRFFLVVGRPSVAQLDAFVEDVASLSAQAEDNAAYSVEASHPFGTNPNGGFLSVVSAFLNKSERFARRVVLLTPALPEWYELSVRLAYKQHRIHLCVRQGDAGAEGSTLSDLSAVAADKCLGAFVLSDPGCAREDKLSILRCVALRKYLPAERIILQLGGDSCSRLALNVGVRQVVSFNQIKMHLLARSVTSCPGIVPLLYLLLKGVDDGPRFHRTHVPSCLAGLSLRATALHFYLHYGILIFGVIDPAESSAQVKERMVRKQNHANKKKLRIRRSLNVETRPFTGFKSTAPAVKKSHQVRDLSYGDNSSALVVRNNRNNTSIHGGKGHEIIGDMDNASHDGKHLRMFSAPPVTSNSKSEENGRDLNTNKNKAIENQQKQQQITVPYQMVNHSAYAFSNDLNLSKNTPRFQVFSNEASASNDTTTKQISSNANSNIASINNISPNDELKNHRQFKPQNNSDDSFIDHSNIVNKNSPQEQLINADHNDLEARIPRMTLLPQPLRRLHTIDGKQSAPYPIRQSTGRRLQQRRDRIMRESSQSDKDATGEEEGFDYSPYDDTNDEENQFDEDDDYDEYLDGIQYETERSSRQMRTQPGTYDGPENAVGSNCVNLKSIANFKMESMDKNVSNSRVRTGLPVSPTLHDDHAAPLPFAASPTPKGTQPLFNKKSPPAVQPPSGQVPGSSAPRPAFSRPSPRRGSFALPVDALDNKWLSDSERGGVHSQEGVKFGQEGSLLFSRCESDFALDLVDEIFDENDQIPAEDVYQPHNNFDSFGPGVTRNSQNNNINNINNINLERNSFSEAASPKLSIDNSRLTSRKASPFNRDIREPSPHMPLSSSIGLQPHSSKLQFASSPSAVFIPTHQSTSANPKLSGALNPPSPLPPLPLPASSSSLVKISPSPSSIPLKDLKEVNTLSLIEKASQEQSEETAHGHPERILLGFQQKRRIKRGQMFCLIAANPFALSSFLSLEKAPALLLASRGGMPDNNSALPRARQSPGESKKKKKFYSTPNLGDSKKKRNSTERQSQSKYHHHHHLSKNTNGTDNNTNPGQHPNELTVRTMPAAFRSIAAPTVEAPRPLLKFQSQRTQLDPSSLLAVDVYDTPSLLAFNRYKREQNSAQFPPLSSNSLSTNQNASQQQQQLVKNKDMFPSDSENSPHHSNLLPLDPAAHQIPSQLRQGHSPESSNPPTRRNRPQWATLFDDPSHSSAPNDQRDVYIEGVDNNTSNSGSNKNGKDHQRNIKNAQTLSLERSSLHNSNATDAALKPTNALYSPSLLSIRLDDNQRDLSFKSSSVAAPKNSYTNSIRPPAVRISGTTWAYPHSRSSDNDIHAPQFFSIHTPINASSLINYTADSTEKLLPPQQQQQFANKPIFNVSPSFPQPTSALLPSGIHPSFLPYTQQPSTVGLNPNSRAGIRAVKSVVCPSFQYALRYNFVHPESPLLVVCGWPRTLAVLLQSLTYESRRGRRWNVVVLSPEVPPPFASIRSLEPFSHFCVVVEGSPMRSGDLAKAGISQARGTLVFSTVLDVEEDDKLLDEAVDRDVDAILVTRKIRALKQTTAAAFSAVIDNQNKYRNAANPNIHIAVNPSIPQVMNLVTELRFPKNVRFLDETGWWPSSFKTPQILPRSVILGERLDPRTVLISKVATVDIQVMENAPVFRSGAIFVDAAMYCLATCSSLVSPFTIGLKVFCALIGTEDISLDVQKKKKKNGLSSSQLQQVQLQNLLSGGGLVQAARVELLPNSGTICVPFPDKASRADFLKSFVQQQVLFNRQQQKKESKKMKKMDTIDSTYFHDNPTDHDETMATLPSTFFNSRNSNSNNNKDSKEPNKMIKSLTKPIVECFSSSTANDTKNNLTNNAASSHTLAGRSSFSLTGMQSAFNLASADRNSPSPVKTKHDVNNVYPPLRIERRLSDEAVLSAAGISNPFPPIRASSTSIAYPTANSTLRPQNQSSSNLEANLNTVVVKEEGNNSLGGSNLILRKGYTVPLSSALNANKNTKVNISSSSLTDADIHPHYKSGKIIPSPVTTSLNKTQPSRYVVPSTHFRSTSYSPDESNLEEVARNRVRHRRSLFSEDEVLSKDILSGSAAAALNHNTVGPTSNLAATLRTALRREPKLEDKDNFDWLRPGLSVNATGSLHSTRTLTPAGAAMAMSVLNQLTVRSKLSSTSTSNLLHDAVASHSLHYAPGNNNNHASISNNMSMSLNNIDGGNVNNPHLSHQPTMTNTDRVFGMGPLDLAIFAAAAAATATNRSGDGGNRSRNVLLDAASSVIVPSRTTRSQSSTSSSSSLSSSSSSSSISSTFSSDYLKQQQQQRESEDENQSDLSSRATKNSSRHRSRRSRRESKRSNSIVSPSSEKFSSPTQRTRSKSFNQNFIGKVLSPSSQTQQTNAQNASLIHLSPPKNTLPSNRTSTLFPSYSHDDRMSRLNNPSPSRVTFHPSERDPHNMKDPRVDCLQIPLYPDGLPSAVSTPAKSTCSPLRPRRHISDRSLPKFSLLARPTDPSDPLPSPRRLSIVPQISSSSILPSYPFTSHHVPSFDENNSIRPLSAHSVVEEGRMDSSCLPDMKRKEIKSPEMILKASSPIHRHPVSDDVLVDDDNDDEMFNVADIFPGIPLHDISFGQAAELLLNSLGVVPIAILRCSENSIEGGSSAFDAIGSTLGGGWCEGLSVMPKPDSLIRKGDRLFVLASTHQLEKLQKCSTKYQEILQVIRDESVDLEKFFLEQQQLQEQNLVQ